MNLLRRAFIDPYRAIMDPTVNALKYLPPTQRFQLTVYLSVMWTVIFCVGTGAWLWFGQLVVLHLLAAVGALITGLTFRIAGAERTDLLAERVGSNLQLGSIRRLSGRDCSRQVVEMAGITVWFDGDCPLCLREIALMQRLDHRGAIAFNDVARGNASCPVDRRELLARFHAQENGRLLSGAEAFAAMWRAIPVLRPFGLLARNRRVLAGLERAYFAFLKVRPKLQAWARRREATRVPAV